MEPPNRSGSVLELSLTCLAHAWHSPDTTRPPCGSGTPPSRSCNRSDQSPPSFSATRRASGARRDWRSDHRKSFKILDFSKKYPHPGCSPRGAGPVVRGRGCCPGAAERPGSVGGVSGMRQTRHRVSQYRSGAVGSVLASPRCPQGDL